MHEGILKRFDDIEKHVAAAKLALEAKDPEAVLSEVQRLNVYVQDLLVMSHKYRSSRLEERRSEEDQHEGRTIGEGEQDSPGSPESSAQES
jgi:hypothetical protein